MSKRRSRNAARLGGSSIRPPSTAEERRTSAQLQSERYRLGIATPEEGKPKKKPGSKAKSASARDANEKGNAPRTSKASPSRPTKSQRTIAVSTSAPMKQSSSNPSDIRSGSMDWKTAVVAVLSNGDSLTAGEISERIYSTGLSEELASDGLLGDNPYEAIRQAVNGANADGTAITRWRDPVDAAIRYTLGDRRPQRPAPTARSSHSASKSDPSRRHRAPGAPPTLLDAAELALKHHADGQPLHIRDVVSLAVEHGYWSTGGKTPTNTLSARVGTEIKQRQSSGQCQRFTRPWRGYLGLTAWETSGSGPIVKANGRRAEHETASRTIGIDEIDFADDVATNAEATVGEADVAGIDSASAGADLDPEGPPASAIGDASDQEFARSPTPETVNALAEYLATLEPRDFIRCLTTYFAAIGAVQLTFAGGAGCFDISARGAVDAAGLFRRPLAVHVSSDVGHLVTASDIAVCRGQAGAYDLALVIALGGFSSEARGEARRAGTLPVEVLDRTGFAQELFDLQIGVRVERIDTYEVGPYF